MSLCVWEVTSDNLLILLSHVMRAVLSVIRWQEFGLLGRPAIPYLPPSFMSLCCACFPSSGCIVFKAGRWRPAEIFFFFSSLLHKGLHGLARSSSWEAEIITLVLVIRAALREKSNTPFKWIELFSSDVLYFVKCQSLSIYGRCFTVVKWIFFFGTSICLCVLRCTVLCTVCVYWFKNGCFMFVYMHALKIHMGQAN